ncbi:MAG: toll/interleukin-1 receptor domain-containing protein [Gammaproteobacteria bacterium]
MGRIFISYRRDDCAADANALYQSLAAEFDKESIFKDVDDVELGANWKTAIQKAVQKSSVLLLLMGSKWQYSGAIQIEVESALDTGVPMIPLLVNGAQIAEVVATLEGRATIIGDLNAASLDHSSWNRDLIPVIEAVRKHLGEQAKPAGSLIDKTSRTPAGDWRVEIVEWKEEPPYGFRLGVQLSSESHEIVYQGNRIFPGGSVVVDGKQVSRSSSFTNERHKFSLSDGQTTYGAELVATGMTMNNVELIVADRRLLSKRK